MHIHGCILIKHTHSSAASSGTMTSTNQERSSCVDLAHCLQQASPLSTALAQSVGECWECPKLIQAGPPAL